MSGTASGDGASFISNRDRLSKNRFRHQPACAGTIKCGRVRDADGERGFNDCNGCDVRFGVNPAIDGHDGQRGGGNWQRNNSGQHGLERIIRHYARQQCAIRQNLPVGGNWLSCFASLTHMSIQSGI